MHIYICILTATEQFYYTLFLQYLQYHHSQHKKYLETVPLYIHHIFLLLIPYYLTYKTYHS